ncbi:MAG: hypothetical protein CMM49_02020 [Rhodospirillaceae bacterium]|nr:hypothetical protein [Rhodospirillaceae bacterium]|tara:strand:- start:47510 stop:49231 length:1722 start_codon:yes stop_codon:yes gene_type:complete
MFFRDIIIYKKIISINKLFIALLVLMGGIAALFEGAAIILLIPILELSTNSPINPTSNPAISIIIDSLQFLGLVFTVPNLLIAFLFIGIFSVILVWLSNVSIHWLVVNSDSRMRKDLFQYIVKSDWPYLSKQKTGEILKALNVDPVQSGIGYFNLLFAGTSFIATVAHLTFAFLLSWKLTILAIIFMVIIFPIYISQIRLGKKMATKASLHDNELNTKSSEYLSNAKFFFSLGIRKYLYLNYNKFINDYKFSKFKQETYVESSRLFFELISIIFISSFLYIVFVATDWSIMNGIVFIALFYRLAPKIITIQGCLFRATNHSAWLSNWVKIVDAFKQNPYDHSGTLRVDFNKSINLSNVSFMYPDRNNSSIINANLEINLGECITIIGPSGHGKSTLLDLITGLIKPSKGIITIDNIDINEIDISIWQNQIGFLPQEVNILNGTIQSNIVFSRDEGEIDNDFLLKVLDISNCENFINKLPDGLDTVVGERGSSLSGGQRQRIGLARALYRNPKLLILDEPTSALDKVNTYKIINNIKSLKSNISVIIVSHDDEMKNISDKVFEISNGRIVLQNS